MSCLSNKEVKDALTGLITTHLHTRSLAGTKIELEPYIREIYDFIKNASGDEVTALTGARMVPTLINIITVYKPELADQIEAVNPTLLTDAYSLSRSFEKSIDNTINYLNLNPPVLREGETAESIKRDLNESRDQAIADAKLLFDQGFDVSESNTGQIVSVGTEVQGKQERNFAVMRNINEALTKQMQSDSIDSSVHMKYPGVDGGVYVRIMSLNHVYDTYEESRVTLTRDEKKRGELVAILTDNTGRALRFDETGNIIPGGKIAYYLLKSDPTKLIRPFTAKDVEKEVSDEVKVRKGKNTLSAEAYNNLHNEVTQEILARHELFRKLRLDLTKNPLQARYAAITGMNRGKVNYNTYVLTPLSQITFESPFQPTVVTKEQAVGTNLEGGQTYFTYPGVTDLIKVQLPPLVTKPEMVKTLVSLYTDPLMIQDEFGDVIPLDNQLRRTLIEQYITDKKVHIKFFINKDGSYDLTLNNRKYVLNKTGKPLSEAELNQLRNEIKVELIRGGLAPTLDRYKLDEKGYNIGLRLGAKPVYDINQVNESGPGTIYVDNTDPKNVKYHNTVFQSLHVSDALIKSPESYKHVTIRDVNGQKTIIVDKSIKYTDFLRDNFLTAAVPSADGKIRQINPSFRFILSNEALAQYLSESVDEVKTLKPINEAYKGKIIYMTPGSGKSELAKAYDNIIDTDQLIKAELRKRDFQFDDNEHLYDILRRLKQYDLYQDTILPEVGNQALNLAKEGYTILTGSRDIIRITDYVFSQTNKDFIREGVSTTQELHSAKEANKPVIFINQHADEVLSKAPDSTVETEEIVSITKGVEISSTSKGLAAALTNPTELAKSKGNITQSYPVEFRGKTYKDAEAAYQALKDTATKDEGPNSTYNLMVDIIKAKLQQHPRLVTEITKQGGSAWILASTHQPTKQNSVWETGGKNWFIKALNDAYVINTVEPQVTTPSIAPATTETTADSTADDLLKSILNNDKFLEKSAKVKKSEQSATEDQIAAALEWFKNSPIAGQFSFNTVLAAVNTNTPGPAAQWAIHGITLFQYYHPDGTIDKNASADYTDLYHEAWHAFTQTFLTKEQRTAMYDEVRKKKGSFKDYTGTMVQFSIAKPWQLEEFLAEDFRKYMMSGGKTKDNSSPVKMSIFDKILNFLKELFTGVNVDEALYNPLGVPKVQQMYDNLRVGNLSSYNFDVQNRDQTIGVLNKTLEASNKDQPIQVLGYDDANLVVKTVDSLISEFVNQAIRASKAGDGRGIHSYTSQMMQGSDTMLTAYAYVKRQFETKIRQELLSRLETAETQGEKILLENRLKLVDWVIENFGDLQNLSNNKNGKDVIGYHISKSEYLAMDERDLMFDDINETNTYIKAMEAFDRAGNESSQEDLAPADVNYLLRGIHKYKEDGTPELNALYVQDLTEYYIVWNKLSRVIGGGSMSIRDMYNKLQEAAASDPTVAEVVTKLGPPKTITTAETELWVNFWSVFNMPQVKLTQVTVTEENGRYSMTVGTTHTNSDRAGNRWNNNFRLIESPFIIKDRNEGDNYGANYLHLNKILETYYDPINKKFRGSKFNFFRDIGIDLTNKPEIVKAVNDGNVGSAPNILRRIYKMVHLRNVNHVYSLEDLFDEKEATKEGANDFLASEASNFNALQELETKYSDIMSNHMVTNAAGNTQYELTLNNTITISIQAINEAPSYRELIKTPWLSHLDISKNPLAPYNTLDSMFDMEDFKQGGEGIRRVKSVDDPTPIKLNLTNLSGAQIISEDGTEGIESAKADEFTKLIMDFHLLNEAGKPELMRHADKGTSFSLWLTRIRNGSKDGKLYVDPSEFVVTENGNIPGYTKATEKLIKYVDGELRRIKTLKALAEKKELNYDLNYLKEGQNFVIFEDVFPKSLQNRLLKYDSLYTENGEWVDPKLLSDVNKAIGNYFNDQSADVKKLMTFKNKKRSGDNLLYMNDKLVNKVYNYGKGSRSKAEAKDALIRSFVVNSWIFNIESVGLIYGDPAQYKHKKEEFHKRNAGAGSTGTLFATDPDMIDYVNNKGRLYARSIGKEEKALAKDGSYDTAVLEDNIIKSSYLKSLAQGLIESELAKNSKVKQADAEKRVYGFEIDKDGKETGKIGTLEKPYKNGFLYPYTDLNEGDAQGWITFDFYRAISILNGKWSKTQEQLYRDICNKKEVPVSTINEFFPVRKFQYWGNMRVEEDMLPLNAFHKFSLMPLVPTVIKNTTLEKLHDKMVDQGIDYALFESGSKISTITKIKNGEAEKDQFYSDKTAHTFDEASEFTKNTVYLQLLKNQLEIAPHYKEQVTFPTQMRKLIENGMLEGGVPTDFGKELPLVERIKKWNELDANQKLENSPRWRRVLQYEKDLAALTEFRKKELETEAGIQRDKDGKLILEVDDKYNAILTPKLEQFLINQMKDQDLAEHEINFVKSGPNHTLAHDLSLSLSVDKLERVLNSIVVRRLIRQKFKGEALVQVSGAGFESILRGKLSPEEQAKYGTNGLPFYQIKNGKTQAMKVKISLQGDFMNLLYLNHNDGNQIGTLDRLNEMVKDDLWLSTGNHRKMITIIGPRIPVQGLNSMEFAEVFEFLPPEAGNIVVLPSEIVAKSGGDFDIDKLTFMFPSVKTKFIKKFWDTVDGQAKLKELQDQYSSIPELDFSKENVDRILDAEKRTLSEVDMAIFTKLMDKDVRGREVIYPTDVVSEDGLENRILNNMREILEAPENFGDLIRPNDTTLVKPIADELSEYVMGFNPKTRYQTEDLTDDQKGRIAGTRIFEIRYNLYKHMSNNIGKQTLGLGAVDNTYNSIFNRIGMRLNHSYVIPKTKINQKLRILLQHNKLKDEQGRDVISLSDLFDARNENSISDVISQLMNGWVDIAKDAWIFNLQGNKEMAPSLLFLIQAGVPVRQAVLFISHPLIREYVNQQRLNSSTFSGPLETKPDRANLAQYQAKINVLLQMGIPSDKLFYLSKEGEKRSTKKEVSQGYLNSVLEGALNKNPELFNPETIDDTLLDRIKTAAIDEQNGTPFNITSDDRAIFLHFLEIEDMAKAVRDVKLNTNADTSKAGNVFEAENKLLSLDKLKRNPIIPTEMVEKIQKESPISSFFVHDFQATVWGNLFNIRNNPTVNDYLRDLIKESDFMESSVEPTFGQLEDYVKNWRNDLVSFIFQNNIRRFNLNAVLKNGNYNSTALLNSTQIKKVPNLAVGLFGKNVDGQPKLYVDEKNLRNAYKMFKAGIQQNITLEDGTIIKLAELNKKAFPDTAVGQQAFYKFMFERELLRARYEGKKGWDILKERGDVQDKLENYTAIMTDMSTPEIETLVYEETLRDMALDNSFNNWKMFNSFDSVADNYIRIINKYPELERKYNLLQNLSVSVMKKAGVAGRVANIRLLDVMYNAEKLNAWNENLRQLGDPSQIEINTTSSVERERVSKFFADLSIYAFLQSGMNTTGQFSLTRIVPQDVFTSMMTGPRFNFLNNVNFITLDKFTDKFNRVNSGSNRRLRGRYKDYTISDYDLVSDKARDIGQVSVDPVYDTGNLRQRLSTDAAGNVLFFANPSELPNGSSVGALSQTEAKELLAQYPEILFVPNGTTGPISEIFGTTHEEALFKSKDSTNLISIPVKKKMSTNESIYAYKDEVPGEIPNAELKENIDYAIQQIIDYRNNAISRGEKVHIAFPGTGIGQYMVGANDRTGKFPEKGKPKPVALATFVYLSEQLYKHFGYVNPNMDAAMKMMNKPNVVETESEITDDMVRDALTFCF